ncbi:malonate utilization transcriptional regulator [Klebsiella michiganensis]|uniref:Malonate utilization transcriptional regulator n=1 Tax=Klebsiella michiganensis TaxID=1134687 RepID=A0A7H4MY71_9ENTR|nr:malonate utilization transcriptional regulator [Klebsiella michiganensis]
MKKVYENDVQLLKLAEPYQMRQLISIVYSHHRERDADLLALAAEGRMYAAASAVKPVRQVTGNVDTAALQRNTLPLPARLAGETGQHAAGRHLDRQPRVPFISGDHRFLPAHGSRHIPRQIVGNA